MSYEGKGILFPNDRKGANSKAPDYKGRINFNGQEYQLAAWRNEGQRGEYLTLKVEPQSSDDQRRYPSDAE